MIFNSFSWIKYIKLHRSCFFCKISIALNSYTGKTTRSEQTRPCQNPLYGVFVWKVHILLCQHCLVNSGLYSLVQTVCALCLQTIITYWLSATELGHLKQRVHVHAHTKNGKSERKHVSAEIFNFYSINKEKGRNKKRCS